jgi:hypothetical protein
MGRTASKSHTSDPLYPVVRRTLDEILKATNVVAPVDALQAMGRLTKNQYEEWRFGRVDYLERVLSGNLKTLGRILRILTMEAERRGLNASTTVYCQSGQTGRKRRLRFTKSGDPNLEAAYSRHYILRSVPAEGEREHPPSRVRGESGKVG